MEFFPLSFFCAYLLVIGKRKEKNMNFTTFTEKVTKGVQDFLGGQVEVTVRDIRKNNGIYLKGMTMFTEGSNISPTIYLNDFYHMYNAGKTLASVVEDILKIYDSTKVNGNVNMDFFLDYEKIHKQIYCRLINYEKNKDILEKVPHRRYLDFAVVCYFAYTNEIIGNGTIMIQKSHLESWDITEEQMLDAAMENTENVLGFRSFNMLHMMRDMLLDRFSEDLEAMEDGEEELPEEMTVNYVKQTIDDMLKESGKRPMYVVTNKNKCLGAICMMFDKMMSAMADEMGEGFIILPSSVHEVILVPERDGAETERLKEIVAEVNAGHVEPQEVLSNNIYYYDREHHEVIML